MNIEDLGGTIRALLRTACKNGLKPNAVIIGVQILRNINDEVSRITGLDYSKTRPENHTFYGLRIIPDNREVKSVGLMFDEYTYI